MKTLGNVLLFQAGWWICVFFGQGKIPTWAWLAALALILGAHYGGFVRQRSAELVVHLMVSAIGISVDFLLLHFGLMQASGASWGVLPWWLVGMWLLFPIVLAHSLSWLHSKRFLQTLFGSIGGGATYWAGIKLDVLQFTPLMNIAVIFIAWALLLPIFYWLQPKGNATLT